MIPLKEAQEEDLYCLKTELSELRKLHDRLTAVIMLYNDLITRREDHKGSSKSQTIDLFQKYQDLLAERKEKMLKFAARLD